MFTDLLVFHGTTEPIISTTLPNDCFNFSLTHPDNSNLDAENKRSIVSNQPQWNVQTEVPLVEHVWRNHHVVHLVIRETRVNLHFCCHKSCNCCQSFPKHTVIISCRKIPSRPCLQHCLFFYQCFITWFGILSLICTQRHTSSRRSNALADDSRGQLILARLI